TNTANLNLTGYWFISPQTGLPCFSTVAPVLDCTGGSAVIPFVLKSQTIAVTSADVTCGTTGTIPSCTTFQIITGLTATLPLATLNWSFDCDLIVSQATSAV